MSDETVTTPTDEDDPNPDDDTVTEGADTGPMTGVDPEDDEDDE